MYEMSKAIEKAIINRHAFLFIFRSTRCFRGEACSDFTHRLATLPPFSHTAPREFEFTHQHFGDRPQSSQRGDRSDVVLKRCCYPADWRNVHYSPQVWSSKKKEKGGRWGGWYYAPRWHTHQILCWWVSSHWSTSSDKAARWGCTDCQAARLNCIHRSCSLEGAL